MNGYDQWKTASPHDDEPDPVEEAEMWLKRNPEKRDAELYPAVSEVSDARTVIEMLLAHIKEEI
jgi:hypothetical protein